MCRALQTVLIGSHPSQTSHGKLETEKRHCYKRPSRSIITLCHRPFFVFCAFELRRDNGTGERKTRLANSTAPAASAAAAPVGLLRVPATTSLPRCGPWGVAGGAGFRLPLTLLLRRERCATNGQKRGGQRSNTPLEAALSYPLPHARHGQTPRARGHTYRRRCP